MSRTLALALGLFISLSGVLHAKTPSVVVVSGPEASTEVTVLKWALRNAVDTHRNMNLLALDDLIGGGAVAGTMALEKGVEALENLEFDDASKLLRKAALNLVGHRRHENEATRALYHLGRAHMALRAEPRAQTSFALLFRLRPDFQPPDGTASPSVRRTMAAGGERANQTQTGTIDVSWKGGTAAVFVNGRFRGMTPQSITELPAGPHHVRLTVDGSADALEVLEVSPKRTSRVSGKARSLAKSTLWRRVMAGVESDPPEDGALRNLGAMTGAQHAILVVEDDGISLVLYDLVRQARIRSIPVDLMAVARPTGPQLLETLYAGLDPLAPNMLAAADLAAEEVPWDTRWLLWSAAAAGLVAAIVVPIALLSGEEEGGIPATPSTGAVIVRY